ncbi:hypothetical protein [Saccharothrix syringae]|uniref:Uncharacterized protein n=1 Tax=Saccharothrix syringae TaxID=103733 RepID=A0A5Q0HBK2_SACSY|nr:hypothetical protein [Saccharothrix syringae]QFZ23344.1 hypothetical protein EKG83_43185 [Saccharothrix syringae]
MTIAANYFGYEWGTDQWIGLGFALAAVAFILGVLLWERIKDATTIRYLRDWTWKRHPQKRKRPRGQSD